MRRHETHHPSTYNSALAFPTYRVFWFGQDRFAVCLLTDLDGSGRHGGRLVCPPAAKSPSTAKFCDHNFSPVLSHSLRFQRE